MKDLHIVLLPLMLHGHMIPALDMAKAFASRGLKTTIISTPHFSQPIIRAQQSGHNIALTTLKFPPENSPLPENFETLDPLSSPDLMSKYIRALYLLQNPVEKLLGELKPTSLISDMFLPWTNDSASKLGIPRLVFHGTSCFALCVSVQMHLHKPYRDTSLDLDTFFVRGLPHELTFFRTQFAPFELDEDSEDDFAKLLRHSGESDGKSYGVVLNTFYELEPAYVDHYTKVLGRKAWAVGPLLLSGGPGWENSRRGEDPCINENECVAWLDSKESSSVVYLCFGSMATFSRAQLQETAAGLEESGRDFIWVMRQGETELRDFEERTNCKGLVIRGWAPQVAILNHRAVGAFVTHCGWNSILEGLCAGVPMVAWPLFAEQFYNEKLVTEVLEVGVVVGSTKWGPVENEGVGWEAVRAAVEAVMEGEGAEEIRRRAGRFKEMAREAVEEGGSARVGLNSMIDELSNLANSKKQDIGK